MQQGLCVTVRLVTTFEHQRTRGLESDAWSKVVTHAFVWCITLVLPVDDFRHARKCLEHLLLACDAEIKAIICSVWFAKVAIIIYTVRIQNQGRKKVRCPKFHSQKPWFDFWQSFWVFPKIAINFNRGKAHPSEVKYWKFRAGRGQKTEHTLN